jgi:enoyl-CoA hydratase/carnithine racemase
MIAACSPRSIAVTKRLLNAVPTQTFAEAFEIARVEAAAAMASPHFREGVAAMKERRAPNFPADY